MFYENKNSKREILFPVRVVESEGKISNIDALLREKPLQIGLSEKDYCSIDGKGYIILDFGKEMCGGVRILTYMTNGACKIRIRFGESVNETCAELGEKGACNDHSTRDMIVDIQLLSSMLFGGSGFRFVRIDFLDDVQVSIKNIVADGAVYNGEQIFDYTGHDARIKNIFDTAKRTIDLCCATEYIWDGIKRDRLVWIGDIYPEMIAFVTVYGRGEILERSLDFIREQSPLPEWMNGFPTYSMWWMIICADYYKKTGCKDFAERQLDYMSALLEQIDSCIKDDGEFEYPLYFVDWPTHDQIDEIPGVRAINIIAAKKAIELFGAFGRDTKVAERILEKLLKVEIEIETAKQCIALKYFAVGKLSEEEKAKLVDGGAKGMSTFMSYFLLKAIADNCGKDVAINIMKEYYGAMLDIGATTFFEDFDMEWLEGAGRIDERTKEGQKDIHGDYGKFCYIGFRHSFCHGWSAGVIPFIQEYCD